MFILPYHFSSRSFQGIHITTFHCLTLGGALLWKEDDSLDVVHDIVEPNGIYLASPPMWIKDIVFCEVDTKRTNLADQYQWEEIPLTDRETFCWRTYYLMSRGMGTVTTDWLPLPVEERLEPYSFQEIMDAFSQTSSKR